MVFEDLHFADSGLIDFVDHLLEWSRGHPIYVVTLSRPELLEKRPDWGAGKRSFTSIYLEPLPEPAMRTLLAGLVPGLPESAARRSSPARMGSRCTPSRRCGCSSRTGGLSWRTVPTTRSAT